MAIRATWKRLRAAALKLPGASEEFPWGDRVVKVNKKIFIFLGEGTTDAPTIALKLRGDSHAHALSLRGAVPTGYGLGKAGWVTLPVGDPKAPPELLLEWLWESYLLIAPKRLSQTAAAVR